MAFAAARSQCDNGAVRIADLLRRHHGSLTPAERRVAEVIVSDPEAVAFGTVSSVAARATTGGATVLRLASKLELSGFSDLQSLVRDELSRRLRPAVERIREPAAGDALAEARRVEVANLVASLDDIEAPVFVAAVDLLASLSRPVAMLCSAASRGVGLQFVTELGSLRPGVSQIEGNQVDVLRSIALLPENAVVVTLDFHRYDTWLLEALEALGTRNGSISSLAITDSPISPLAMRTDVALVVAGQGVGPFDSWLGALAVLQALTAAVAARLVDPATERLDAAEQAWRRTRALRDD